MAELESDQPRHLFVASRDGLCGVLCGAGEPQVLPQALYGDSIRCLVSSGRSIAVATSDRGSWLSDDGGFHFAEVGGLDGVAVVTLAADGMTIFAGTEPARLFRSDDGGKSFQEATRLLGPWSDDWRTPEGREAPRVSSIVVRGTRVVVGIADGGVLLSESGGDEFRSVSDGIDSRVLTLAAPANDDQNFFAGTVDGVYRSPSLGTSVWRQVFRPRARRAVTALAIHPSNPESIVCASSRALVLAKPGEPAGADTSLFRSTDGGSSFEPVTAGLKPVLRGIVTAIVHVPNDPDRLFIGTSAGEIYESRDGGTSFRMAASTLPGVLDLDLGPGFAA